MDTADGLEVEGIGEVVIDDNEDVEGIGGMEALTFIEAITNGSTCSSDIRDGSRGTSSGSGATGPMTPAGLARDFGSGPAFLSNASSGGTIDDALALKFGTLSLPGSAGGVGTVLDAREDCFCGERGVCGVEISCIGTLTLAMLFRFS